MAVDICFSVMARSARSLRIFSPKGVISAFPVSPQFHIEGPTAAVLGVSLLETGNMGTKLRFVQPFGQLPAQAPFPFGSIKMIPAMEGVAGKRRGALAGNDQNEAVALHAAAGNEIQKADAGFLQIHAVQIKAAFN